MKGILLVGVIYILVGIAPTDAISCTGRGSCRNGLGCVIGIVEFDVFGQTQRSFAKGCSSSCRNAGKLECNDKFCCCTSHDYCNEPDPNKAIDKEAQKKICEHPAIRDQPECRGGRRSADVGTTGALECAGKSGTCPAGTGCIIGNLEIKIFGQTQRTFVTGCASQCRDKGKLECNEEYCCCSSGNNCNEPDASKATDKEAQKKICEHHAIMHRSACRGLQHLSANEDPEGGMEMDTPNGAFSGMLLFK